MSAATDLLLLLLFSLVPALIYLAWVRSSERYGAEPRGRVLNLFFFGALAATFVAGILELILVDAGTAASSRIPEPEFSFLNGNSTAGLFFLVLVIAPFIEEALKAWGVVRQASGIRVAADGAVFGASVGLGFGFFETFLYGLGEYLVGGLEAGLVLIVVRSVSSVLLHGSSTAVFGLGYARDRLEHRGGAASGYMAAVGMHASFNLLASLGSVALFLGLGSGLTPYADLLGLVASILFAMAAINYVVDAIHQSSFPSAHGSTRYRPPSIDPRLGRPPRTR